MTECRFGECDGSGFLVDTERMETRECRCRPERVAARRAKRLRTVIPRRYEGVSFDRNPVATMDPYVVGLVRRYVEDIEANLDEGRGLWLEGERSGTGKTTLAMLVSKAAIERRRTVVIYSVPLLLARLRRTFADESEGSYSEIVEALTSVDLLHLDDLGAEKSSEWVLEQLYTIVNARYEEEKAIVLTTNLKVDTLTEQIGARTVSRLMEMCGDVVPIADEVDHRRSHAPPEIVASGGPYRYGQLPT